MHEVLVNRLGGLSLPRKSVVRLTDRPDMTLDVYRGRKTTNQQSTVIFTFSNTLTKTLHHKICINTSGQGFKKTLHSLSVLSLTIFAINAIKIALIANGVFFKTLSRSVNLQLL